MCLIMVKRVVLWNMKEDHCFIKALMSKRLTILVRENLLEALLNGKSFS